MAGTRSPARPRSPWIQVVRTPLGAVAAVLVVTVLAVAVLAPVLWGDEAAAYDTGAINQKASGEHWFGTDQLGRDLFYRALVATRLSIGLALLATLISVVLGTILGTAPTVLPRWAARAVTGVVNVAVAFPGLLLALFFAVIFGVGTQGAVLAIGLAGAPSFARLTQTLAASVAGRDFVAAARVAGVGRLRLLRRHILPNIAEPLVISATIGAGGALLAFAGLSFLGIGVQAPSYDWGRLLGEGMQRIYINPAAALGPGAAIVLAGLAFNLAGETAAAVLGGRSSTTRTRRRTAREAPRSPRDHLPTAAVLTVRNLSVRIPHPSGWSTPVRNVSFSVRPGEVVGLVGESGSGKSLTALAVARLLEEPIEVTADRLDFDGRSLLAPSDRAERRHLGTSMAMVFQDPMSSFNPTRRIGRQLAELSEEHHGLSRRAAMRRAVDRLGAVRIPMPERRARQYPHEFSGGMRQRAMIGLGLMGEPKLIIADEPTTALDVTVQQQVLRLIDDVRRDSDAAVLLISHDISVVSQTCDRVLVMYAGRIVEDLPTDDLFAAARHPYTRALLAAVPDLETDRDRPLHVIPGRPPEPHDLPGGCAFAARCSSAGDRCLSEEPPLQGSVAPDADDAEDERGRLACWHPGTGSSAALAQDGLDSQASVVGGTR